MKEEQWKQVVIDGEKWDYEVSTESRVRSMRYGNILKQTPTKIGYLQVTFQVQYKRKTFYVHRLVANAFIPNPNGYTDVNHINEDKTDNRVENLQWVSHKQNMQHGTQAERGIQTRKKRYFETNQVFIKVKHIDTGIVYSSIRQAEKETGYTGADIYDCCKRGEHWEFIGWEYVE